MSLLPSLPSQFADLMGGREVFVAVIAVEESPFPGADPKAVRKVMKACHQLLEETCVPLGGRVYPRDTHARVVTFHPGGEVVRLVRGLVAKLVRLDSGRLVTIRAGLHFGSLIVEGHRLRGDALKVAVALQGLASAGGVCLSEAVLQTADAEVQAAVLERGPQAVEGQPEPIMVYELEPPVPGARSGSQSRVLPKVSPSSPTPGDPRQRQKRMLALAVGGTLGGLVVLATVLALVLPLVMDPGQPAPAPSASPPPAIATRPPGGFAALPTPTPEPTADMVNPLERWAVVPTVAVTPGPTATRGPTPTPKPKVPTPTPTPEGPPPPPRDATQRFEAARCDTRSPEVRADGVVSYYNNGRWVRYRAIDFKDGVAQVHLSLSQANNTATSYIQFRLDSPDGPMIGEIKVSRTGGWDKFETRATLIQGASGVRDLYLVAKGAGANVKWFQFFTQPVEPASAPATPAAKP